VPEGAVSLAVADFDDLRGLGMSVTQAKRVLRHRDETGFTTTDDLDQVPGFPKAFLGELKQKLVP
jgi:DNA uptake protein ComE-like DNA-binding protein